ncbi:MAG: zf-HC2 domain-containing protein [Planctomycetota bacterium]
MSNHHETTCERSAESRGLFASGELTDRELATLDEHLRSCEDCRRRLRELQRVADSLAGGEPVWLESAGEAVLKRVAAELEVDKPAFSHDPASVAANLRSGERDNPRHGRRDHRGWTWPVLGVLAAGLAGVGLSGWFGDWWKSIPVQPGEPTSTVEARPFKEPRVLEAVHRPESEFPTWWEMQRALLESDEAFQRTLARGRTGASSQPLDLNHLLKELTQ